MVTLGQNVRITWKVNGELRTREGTVRALFKHHIGLAISYRPVGNIHPTHYWNSIPRQSIVRVENIHP